MMGRVGHPLGRGNVPGQEWKAERQEGGWISIRRLQGRGWIDGEVSQRQPLSHT